MKSTILLLLLSSFMIKVLSHSCEIYTVNNQLSARCNNLNLNEIPTDLDSQIKVLRCESNHLTSISSVSFVRYFQLQEIYLKKNQLKSIPYRLFFPVENLQILDLSRNRLESIPTTALEYTPKLREIILSYNYINRIDEFSFKNLARLLKLDISHCHIRFIQPNSLKNLKSLTELNVIGNELKGLISTTILPKSLTVFRLHHNKWICDCKLRWLLQFLTNNKLKISWTFGNRIPRCQNPELLKGVRWTELNSTNFACAPTIIRYTSYVSVNATLNCLSTGDPQPEVTWYKKNLRVTPSKRNRITFWRTFKKALDIFHYNSSLKIINMTEKDIGLYKCVSLNSAGRSEVTISLSGSSSMRAESNWEKKKLRALSASLTCFLLVILCSIISILMLRIIKRRRLSGVYRIQNQGAESAGSKCEEDATASPLQQIDSITHKHAETPNSTPDLLKNNWTEEEAVGTAV
ncbi:unnamed protein product [Dimorphilus gyrociliatus]|uniref:Ig-like domain-containing protein n=1 Tax=Dimorphilus gyrociliatus TaxID=2664684 RepID=A0A7I8VDA7_9ANNE|nr:unnamed protein product [Dimorphilus gyrociliatus]